MLWFEKCLDSRKIIILHPMQYGGGIKIEGKLIKNIKYIKQEG